MIQFASLLTTRVRKTGTRLMNWHRRRQLARVITRPVQTGKFLLGEIEFLLNALKPESFGNFPQPGDRARVFICQFGNIDIYHTQLVAVLTDMREGRPINQETIRAINVKPVRQHTFWVSDEGYYLNEVIAVFQWRNAVIDLLRTLTKADDDYQVYVMRVGGSLLRDIHLTLCGLIDRQLNQGIK